MKFICPRCGKKVKMGKPYCPRCGLPMPPPPPNMKKKHTGLRILLAFAIILAILALLWFAVGNMVTLYVHSEDVVEQLNSGDLDLPGVRNTDFSVLPHYMQQTLGETAEAQSDGPIMEAVLPYLRVERETIHGFFTQSSVDYSISAPDLETWLLSTDLMQFSSQDELLGAMLDYIPSAPLRTVTVTVEYDRDGLFGWRGEYQTVEFADAVSGGLNTAYNVLYEQMLKELEEALG